MTNQFNDFIEIGKTKIAVIDGDRGTNYPNKDELMTTGECLFLSAKNVTKNGFKFDESLFISSSKDQLLRKGKLQRGDIVVTTRGTIGNVAYFHESIPYENIRINSGMAILRNKDDNFFTPFIYHFLRSDYTFKQVERLNYGSAQPQLTIEILKKLEAPKLEKSEQQAIVKILSLWDRKIDVCSELIETKREHKRALMQRLLTGKLRFPEFAGKPWQEVAIDDVFMRITRRNTEVHANVVTISAQRGFVKQGEYFNKSVASETLDNYFLLHRGEFAYNKSYSNGYPMGAIKRLNNFDKGVVTTLYICFALKDQTRSCAEFFEQFFEWGALNAGLTKVANEGGRAHGLLNVTPSDFFSLKLPIPGIDEQRKIAAVLSAADHEIDQLTKKLDAYKQQKKGLMQQLLTGKKRVKLDSKEAA